MLPSVTRFTRPRHTSIWIFGEGGRIKRHAFVNHVFVTKFAYVCLGLFCCCGTTFFKTTWTENCVYIKAFWYSQQHRGPLKPRERQLEVAIEEQVNNRADIVYLTSYLVTIVLPVLNCADVVYLASYLVTIVLPVP